MAIHFYDFQQPIKLLLIQEILKDFTECQKLEKNEIKKYECSFTGSSSFQYLCRNTQTIISSFLQFITTTVLDAFAKLRKANSTFFTSVRQSIRPHGTTRLQPYGFSRNLLRENFSKICRENSTFIKF